MTINKKLRFEVFKRDSFRCQYCGATAPDVVLEVDHIKPKKEGGKDSITNLVTACKACNSGKGARLLNDNTVMEKQRQQLEELNERRTQLGMMMKWREGLEKLNEDALNIVINSFEEKARCTVTEQGGNNLKKLLKKYSLQMILDAVDDSCAAYLVKEKSGKDYTDDSRSKAFQYIGKICNIKMVEQDKPYIKDLFYIRGILRNRFNYLDEPLALRFLETAYIGGASIESLKTLAIDARNWSDWRNAIEEFIGGRE